ncbi:MAG: hypothetical protein ACQEQL_08685 [Pseudomonadota bacterium]
MNKSSQAGNALFLILIAVALFAALSYAVTRSDRGGGDIDREMAELGAARIINHLADVQAAVQRLTMTGVPLEQLDFYTPERVNNTGGGSYSFNNTLCTSDFCEIHHHDGGGVPYQIFEDLAETDPLPAGWSDNWEAPGHTQGQLFSIDGVGSDLPEIGYEIRVIKPEICRIINQRMGLPAEPARINDSATETRTIISGDISADLSDTSKVLIKAADHPALVGAQTVCLNYGGSDALFVKHVLIAR